MRGNLTNDEAAIRVYDNEDFARSYIPRLREVTELNKSPEVIQARNRVSIIHRRAGLGSLGICGMVPLFFGLVGLLTGSRYERENQPQQVLREINEINKINYPIDK